MNLEIVGTGIAGVITNFTILFFNILYSNCLRDIKPAIIWPDARTFKEIRPYLRIGIPAAMMLVLDVWAGSLVIFFSGYISSACLGAMSLLTNIMVVLYMVGRGLEQAACTIIGQKLGQNEVKKARLYFHTLKPLSAIMILMVTLF
jgi:Na+-driven multidrug efflux pump